MILMTVASLFTLLNSHSAEDSATLKKKRKKKRNSFFWQLIGNIGTFN